MSGLTVEPEASETTIFGKTVSALQSDVSVGDNAITGTLMYVSDYTEFNTEPAKQKGNFLVLKWTNSTVGSSVAVELINGMSDSVKVDGDTKAVILVNNKASQKVKFTITKDGDKASKLYDLSGLTLQSAG